MNPNKDKKELRISIGVGIILEGLIVFAIAQIATTAEALGAFATMLVVCLFLIIFVYMASTGNEERSRKMREHSH